MPRLNAVTEIRLCGQRSFISRALVIKDVVLR